jgi:tetratricopeptide (TPR) repeat protein
VNRVGAYRTALVMIARDEAKHIERALASVRGAVDELVVLDTGSSDATVHLARSAGARVENFRWIDDFSAARNAALELAGADWHLVLDADEWVESGADMLPRLRHTPPSFAGAVRIDSRFGAGDIAPSWLTRVLPGSLRYAGRVHEQPVHGLALQRLPLVIGHDGYRPQALAAKSGRNAALLRRALAECPQDAYLWYQLGKDHDVYERHADALACFERAAALAPTAAPWHHDMLVRSLHACKCCDRHAEGLQRAEAALDTWSHSPDFFFALGDLLLDWAADEPVRADELLPMADAAWQRCIEIGERPDLEGSVAGRGSHLAAHNLAVLRHGTGRMPGA